MMAKSHSACDVIGIGIGIGIGKVAIEVSKWTKSVSDLSPSGGAIHGELASSRLPRTKTQVIMSGLSNFDKLSSVLEETINALK